MRGFIKKRTLCCVFLVFLTISCASSTSSVRHTTDQKIIGNFALLDHKGKFQELYYYSDQKAVVLISQGNGCPIIRKSFSYIEDLKKQFSHRGVVFFFINANPQDDRESIQKEADDHGVTIPILEDRSQIVSASLGIQRNAQVIVLDVRDWSVVYDGAIHDQFGYETQRDKVHHEYLKDALNALLKDRPVAVKSTPVKGCLISYPHENLPVYINDVAPILIKKCIACHSQGQIAPWSMESYEHVKGWGAMIREVVSTRRMPPWGADPHYRKLKEDISLTPQEMKTICDWIDRGMVRGEGEDPLLKAKRPPMDEWPLGPPDMVLTFDKEQHIPENGLIDLRTIMMRETMEMDAWVRAIYWKIGNRKVVHHTNISAYVLEPNQTDNIEWFMRSGVDYSLKNRKRPTVENNDHIIDSFTPGKEPLIMPEGTGMFLPKGSRFRTEMHYTTTGRPETDLTEVGLYFYKERPKHIFSFSAHPKHDLVIPPFKKDHTVEHSFIFKKNVTLYSIKPHMHLRGRSQEFIFYYPDGTSEKVLSVPQFRFKWQRRFSFEEPIKVPAGTRVKITTVYDNSAQNPDNPDPGQTVRTGPYTEDEMLFPTFFYVEE